MKKSTLACLVLILGAGCAVAAFLGCDGETKKIKVSGTAFSFSLPGNPYGRIAGAQISVLEHPEYVITSNEDGTFEFPALPEGIEATFVLQATGFPVAYTKTFTLPGEDMTKLTFQVPPDDLFEMIAGLLSVTIDETKCQLVSTVTRVGKSIYDEGAHGEADATVSLSPTVPAENGPVYFNADVMPDRAQLSSSEDGGVLYFNVPPGDYVMSATKTGVEFESVTMKCRAGVLVNASPPYGLQAQP